MKKPFGHTGGLKASQLLHLERLYRRRIPLQMVASKEIVLEICRLSHEIQRQIGLLIDRHGRVAYVLVGDHHRLWIPETPDFRTAADRLKGLRLVHTHLSREALTQDDYTDLVLLRLDLIAAITISDQGQPMDVHAAHLLPATAARNPHRTIQSLDWAQLDIGCLDLIKALEAELTQIKAVHPASEGQERALLVSVSTKARSQALDSLAELSHLARSAGLNIVGQVVQQRHTVDGRYLMGLGKLQDLTLAAMQQAATVIVFDNELNPSQIRSITDRIALKVIDRTQLILDIFAQRAKSREGKLQVELAQLRYLLPRLVTKNTAMSRLTGGIGGRGPGETKLEINRRRAHERINRLEKALAQVQHHRGRQRGRRQKNALPIISIIGYTNAGKSTLLNSLTKSRVETRNQLFATLDPSSRRLRFPQDIDVIITDTVGFIRDLPADLMTAFRATLEELESADLLLHVIDISNPFCLAQAEAVERILTELKLNHIPTLNVLNKTDLVDHASLMRIRSVLSGIAVSAADSSTLTPLTTQMAARLATIKPAADGANPKSMGSFPVNG
jgi:GTP-binding protein HflX